MVNNYEIIIHKTAKKSVYKHDCIYKKNHPRTPQVVVKMFDIGYLGREKDFPEQLSSIPNKKKRKVELP